MTNRGPGGIFLLRSRPERVIIDMYSERQSILTPVIRACTFRSLGAIKTSRSSIAAQALRKKSRPILASISFREVLLLYIPNNITLLKQTSHARSSVSFLSPA